MAQFFKMLNNRADVVLATKVSGRSNRVNWLPRRDKGTLARVSAEQIVDSADASLERLETEH